MNEKKPRKPPELLKNPTNLTLTPSLVAKAKALANDDGKSLSQWVENLLRHEVAVAEEKAQFGSKGKTTPHDP